MRQTVAKSQSTFVNLWFALDAILVLAPPLHWMVNSYPNLVLGIPATLFYFLAISVLITLSVIVAYQQETQE